MNWRAVLLFIGVIVVITSTASAEWVSNASIISGLADVGTYSTPTVFTDSGELWLISGEDAGVFNGYKRDGTSWVSNASIVSGLPDVGASSTPMVFNDSGELWLISGEFDGVFNGYKRVGSSWVSNASIVSGLADVGDRSSPAVFTDSGELWLISGERYGTFVGYKFNYPPSIPSVLAPVYDSTVFASSVLINISSSDLDGDTLTYYIYGDTTSGTTLINISTTGEYTWSVSDSTTHYWQARAHDGTQYGDNTSLQQFTVLLPPVLSAPTNASTATYPFPPMFHDTVLSWENMNATAYKYQVATHANFNLVSAENTIQTNTTTVSLVADDYYWRVYAYDTTLGAYGGASDVWQFTINETKLSGGTAIDGVVYEVLEGGNVAIDGALINIWNDTWSGSSIVGENGYFFFPNLDNSTYYLKATKNGYTESAIEIMTAVTDETSTRNILLQSTSGSGIEYAEHFVKFTVMSLWGEKYEGVTVKAYLGEAVVATYTGTTGSDGSISFEMDEDQEYRLTFVDASQSINEEITLFPVDISYNVYVYNSLMPDEDEIESEDVTVTVTTSEIDANQAYINVTYTDVMVETTALTMYIKQANEHDPVNLTTIDTANLGATSSVTHSFTVNDYSGQAYFIVIEATHTTFGDIDRTYSARFDGMLEDHGFTKIWVWMGVAGMVFVAGLFKASRAEQGALVVCATGWIFMAMSWFDSLGSQAVLGMKAGLGLATVLAVAANMAKKDRDETV